MSDLSEFPDKASSAHISGLGARFQVQSGGAAIGFALLLLAGSLSLSGCKAHADDAQSYDTPSGLAVPRWAALRAKEVNARNGGKLHAADAERLREILRTGVEARRRRFRRSLQVRRPEPAGQS